MPDDWLKRRVGACRRFCYYACAYSPQGARTEKIQDVIDDDPGINQRKYYFAEGEGLVSELSLEIGKQW